MTSFEVPVAGFTNENIDLKYPEDIYYGVDPIAQKIAAAIEV